MLKLMFQFEIIFSLANFTQIDSLLKCRCQNVMLIVHCQFLSVICLDIASYVRFLDSISTDSIAFLVYILLSYFYFPSFFVINQNRLPTCPLHSQCLQQAMISFDAFDQCHSRMALQCKQQNLCIISQ